MPRYTRSDKNFIIDKIDLAKLIKTAGPGKFYLQAMVAFLWYFGVRPTEALLLRKRDVLAASEGMLTLRLPLIKKKANGAWSGNTHDISFPVRGDDGLFSWLAGFFDHIRKKDSDPESFVFKDFRTRKTLYLKIRELGMMALGREITPYNFRHSCFSHHFLKGDSDAQLMHLKGCHTYESIRPYLHLRPVPLEAA